MHFKLSARGLFSQLVIWLLGSAVLGYMLGYVWVFIAITSVILLVWHYRHLYQLVTWLWQSKAISPPQSEGVWGHIYNGLYRQIKRHRTKQKSLNNKIRLFRDGAEALPDAALVLSNDLTIQWGNKKAQKLLGIRWPGDSGQRIDNLIRFPEFTQYLQAEDFETPCHITSPISTDIHLELRLIAYGSGQVLFLARDVSKIHRLQEMRRDFVANVSHELKTPLTVVRGYVEMIQETDNALGSHWQKAFSSIETQVSRMDRLVEQLLVLSRTEINTDNYDKYQVDIPDLLTHLLEEVKWLNQDKKHKITTDIDPTRGIWGFDTELKSAFANILSNAIAYTPSNGNIHITWQQVGERMKYSVKDDGIGIAKEDINRLTERFYRVDKSRSRDTGGSGLGMAIVKHVVNHHNAYLEIYSEVGKGSEFIIFFNASSITSLSAKKPLSVI